MPLNAAVVEMRVKVQSVFLAALANGHDTVVEINHVRLVIIPELLGAEEKFLAIRRVHLRANRMVLRVEILRVETVPPLALAFGLRQLAVVRHASERAIGIGALGNFIPAPGAPGVNAHRKAQTVFARRRRPAADQIFLRPDGDGIPRLVFGIEQVEVVVMDGQRHEILRAVFFVERQQLVGVKVRRLPDMNDVLEAVGGRMAVFQEVRFVIGAALDIHAARIPVAVFRLALRPPVRPDAELRVAEPVGRLIMRRQGFPRRLERAGGDRRQVQRRRRRIGGL